MLQTTNERTAPLKVVQISDTHLYAPEHGKLLGMNTRHSPQLVLELVAADGMPDLVLATGDLVHDGSDAGYAHLHRMLSSLQRPVYCLPGNHDEVPRLAHWLADAPLHTDSHVRHGAWDFVFLDSTRIGDEGGHLGPDRLAMLADCLENHATGHTLVCLHHQPLPVGSTWLDTMEVSDGDAFFGLIDQFPQVRGVLWGHVHQEFEHTRNGVRLLACPSTCVQFLPGSENFALDPAPPGYRWLSLHDDGRIETGVRRLARTPNGVDLNSGGY